MLADTSVSVALDVGAVVSSVIGLVTVIFIAKVNRKVNTGNGKDIGTTTHDLAQTAEILSAQIHTNTKEVLNSQTNQTRIEGKLDLHIDEACKTHAIILGQLDELTQGGHP